MKSYTDLEQSKKLAEILPLESADMFYDGIQDLYKEKVYNIPTDGSSITVRTGHVITDKGIKANLLLPCWSLAALLNLLPNEIITDNRFECHYQIHIRKYDGGDNTTLYQIAYGNDRGLSGSWHDMVNTGEKESLIDCCVQMILNLKENNLL